MSFFVTLHPIIVEVPESAEGVSIESIFVFIAGVVAAGAAVVAALLTTRGAAKRLQETLDVERDRFDRQVEAERERANDRIAHERYLARREEASASIEKITRLVARTAGQFDEIKRSFLRLKDSDPEALREPLEVLGTQVDQIREEISVVALRFGLQSPVVSSMVKVLTVLLEGSQILRDTVSADGEEWKEQLQEASREVNSASADFVGEAGEALKTY